jgi:ABC-type branched-subunit amino acid transport system permease subunit
VVRVHFDLTLLITVYAMVILGGVGSLAGMIVGAVVLNVSLEVLRDPGDASWLFFLALVLVSALLLRPLWQWAAVAAATVVLGIVAHEIVERTWERGVAGEPAGEAWIDRLVDGWVLLPVRPEEWNRITYLVLVAGVLALTLLKGWKRLALFPPVLYLAACVWESAMLPQPAVARYLLIGAMLVALMAARPQGLLGTARVEIV